MTLPPTPPDAAVLLEQAVRYHQAGAMPTADLLYQKVLLLSPHHEGAVYNLALLRAEAGKPTQSKTMLQRHLLVCPDDANAHHLLARLLESGGELTEARDHYTRVVECAPGRQDAWLDLLRCCDKVGDIASARDVGLRALARFPESQEMRCQFGAVLAAGGAHQEARTLFEAVLGAVPTHAFAQFNLARIADAEGNSGEALDLYQRATANDPDGKLPETVTADLLLKLGYVEEAIANYDAWLLRHPTHADAHSGRLAAAQYQLGVTSESLRALHVTWDERFGRNAQPHKPPPASRRQPREGRSGRSDARPLRCALVSGDLREHAVGFLVVRAIEAIDPAAVEFFAYSDSNPDDPTARRFRQRVRHWRDSSTWSDQQLADAIARDRIDIAFDLAGHSSPSRLPAFARRPAPTQITWAGYVGTTGLAAMDWLIADRFHVPPGTEQHYVEKIIRMPDSYACFDPPGDAPPITSLPAGSGGPLTFGAFLNPAKINAEVARLWTRVLAATPRSRILFAYAGFETAAVQQRIRTWFAEAGGDPGRLDFVGRMPRKDLLRRYGTVDLALDPFPYSGCVTTCEALWMGVPVITLPGETFAGRHTLSHLSNVGLTEFVARDANDYVAIAASWDRDRDRLAALRANIWGMVERSPLSDGPRFANHLLRVLRDLRSGRSIQ